VFSETVQKKRQTKKVRAPPGRLGIIIDTSLEGPKIVDIKEDSPMVDLLKTGDIITSINGVETRAMSGPAVRELIANTTIMARMLTVLTE